MNWGIDRLPTRIYYVYHVGCASPSKVRIMAAISKQTDSSKQHPVMWDATDWRRINEAADVLRARDPLERDVNPTDVIRTATRRYLDEVLGPKEQSATAKAS